MTYNKYTEYLYEKYYRYEYLVNKFVEMQKFFDANYFGVSNCYGRNEFFATIYEARVLNIIKGTNNYCEIKNRIALDFAEEIKTEKEIELELETAIAQIQKDIPMLTNYYNEAAKYINKNSDNIAQNLNEYKKHVFSDQIKQIDRMIGELVEFEDDEEIYKFKVAKEDIITLESFISQDEDNNQIIKDEANKIVDKMKKEQKLFKTALEEKAIIK